MQYKVKRNVFNYKETSVQGNSRFFSKEGQYPSPYSDSSFAQLFNAETATQLKLVAKIYKKTYKLLFIYSISNKL